MTCLIGLLWRLKEGMHVTVWHSTWHRGGAPEAPTVLITAAHTSLAALGGVCAVYFSWFLCAPPLFPTTYFRKKVCDWTEECCETVPLSWSLCGNQPWCSLQSQLHPVPADLSSAWFPWLLLEHGYHAESPWGLKRSRSQSIKIKYRRVSIGLQRQCSCKIAAGVPQSGRRTWPCWLLASFISGGSAGWGGPFSLLMLLPIQGHSNCLEQLLCCFSNQQPEWCSPQWE